MKNIKGFRNIFTNTQFIYNTNNLSKINKLWKNAERVVLALRRIVREKFLAAAGRQKLVYNFLIAYSAEQRQVPRGSIFSSFDIVSCDISISVLK